MKPTLDDMALRLKRSREDVREMLDFVDEMWPHTNMYSYDRGNTIHRQYEEPRGREEGT
jgi:hypothetical protein